MSYLLEIINLSLLGKLIKNNFKQAVRLNCLRHYLTVGI